MRYRVYSFGANNRHLLMIDAEDPLSAAQRFVEGFGERPPFEVVVVLAEGSSNATRYDVRDVQRWSRRGPRAAEGVASPPCAGGAGLARMTTEEKRHGETLGLVGTVTVDDVKRRYRALVALYHPDKVVHLGPKLQAAAEQEMRAINEAYRYFRDRYGF